MCITEREFIEMGEEMNASDSDPYGGKSAFTQTEHNIVAAYLLIACNVFCVCGGVWRGVEVVLCVCVLCVCVCVCVQGSYTRCCMTETVWEEFTEQDLCVCAGDSICVCGGLS